MKYIFILLALLSYSSTVLAASDASFSLERDQNLDKLEEDIANWIAGKTGIVPEREQQGQSQRYRMHFGYAIDGEKIIVPVLLDSQILNVGKSGKKSASINIVSSLPRRILVNSKPALLWMINDWNKSKFSVRLAIEGDYLLAISNIVVTSDISVPGEMILLHLGDVAEVWKSWYPELIRKGILAKEDILIPDTN